MPDPNPFPLSPLEAIEAVKRLQGRDSGPLTAGYVDEDGRPITPQWPQALGLSRETLPAAAGPRRQAPPADPAKEVWELPTTQEPRQVALVELADMTLPPEHVRLDSAAGLWSDNAV